MFHHGPDWLSERLQAHRVSSCPSESGFARGPSWDAPQNMDAKRGHRGLSAALAIHL
jgi:hypothetical protein